MKDLYKEIPKTTVDWSDPMIQVANKWMDGYFETQIFAVNLIGRFYATRRMFYATRRMAISGWSLAALLAICLWLKP